MSLAQIAYEDLRALSISLLEDPSDDHFELVEQLVREYNKKFGGGKTGLDPALFAAWCARSASKRRINNAPILAYASQR